MLKGLDPLLNPELLQVLAAMGHGDEIVVADANFPAASVASRTAHGRTLRCDAPAPRVVEAILSVLPVDDFTDDAVRSMAVVGDAAAVPEVVAEAEGLFAREGATIVPVERFAFYEAAKRAYAVVQTGERRFYGNFIIRKGVVRPD
ncbi:RbsD/FucU family protein [Jiella sp. M17.18]|uniref:RbsD/FucU family protein n=1 Tax=Jiella sp. M17.18 TaxID=3234247 RepID=UPI0034DFAB34